MGRKASLEGFEVSQLLSRAAEEKARHVKTSAGGFSVRVVVSARGTRRKKRKRLRGEKEKVRMSRAT